MSTKEELIKIKQEYDSLNEKMAKLSAEELKLITDGRVAGGFCDVVCPVCGKTVDVLDLRNHYLMFHQ